MGDKLKKNPFEGKRVRFVYDEKEPVNADGERGHLEVVEDAPVSCCHRITFYERFIKRGFDLILSFCGLIVLMPLLIILSIIVYLDDPGPIFFTQKRIGKNKRYFYIHKFRSMKTDSPHEVPTHMLGGSASHVTRVGKVIRRFSLDELPQLWDILIGNMSIVGPRPALWNQDVLVAMRDEYDANDVVPGLTGWAQVNGRDALDLVEKARLDGEYCRKITFTKDVICILMTVKHLLKR